MTKYLVLDTNILLLDANNLITLGKDSTTIVLPETVLDEIDSKKSSLTEIGYQAREVGRLLTRAARIGTRSDATCSVTILSIDDVIVEVMSLKTYPIDLSFDRNVVSDRKIIAVAQRYTEQHIDAEVTFISNDVMCRIRAESLGLRISDLKQVEGTEISFIRGITLGDEDFRTAHNRTVEEIDVDYLPNYFNYVLTNSNTNQVKLATVSNKRLQIIGKETETELRKQDIKPANMEQLFFSKALQDTSIDINICEAKSGTGKTLVAISNGIRSIRRGDYDQLLYIRASVDDVEREEEVGFLSGNTEKMEVYLHPFHDSLDTIIRSRHKDSKLKGPELEVKIAEDVEKLKLTCNMQAMIGLGMRGRTFNNAYVIIDEAQNNSKASIQKMLTRFGHGCKVVVIGSQAQIDNSYITKYTNGLGVLLDACKREHENINLHAVNLPKILRGPIAEFSENLYSN